MLPLPERAILDRLALDNPWWRGAPDPELAGLPKRAFFDGFLRRLERTGPERPLVLIGPRRVGKTVLVRQAIARLIEDGAPPRSLLYADLTAPVVHGVPLERLARGLRAAAGLEGPGVLVLDGVHNVRGWEAEVAVLAAALPDLRVVAVASGAAQRVAGAFVLPPLTFAEYLRLTGAERDLVEPMVFGKGPPMYVVRDMAALNERFGHYINGGGFPEAVLLRPGRDSARLLRGEVLGALLHQDLPGLAGIAGTAELNALFTLLARNTGREVSIEVLAERAGLAKNTVRRHLDYLEASYLILRMGRVHPAGDRFQRMRTFKVHLAAPCLYAALFGPVAPDDPAFAALTESAIVGQWLASAERTRLAYARLPEGPVDLVALDAVTDRPAWVCVLSGSDEATINGMIQFAKRNAPLRWVGSTTRTVASLKAHDGVEVWHRPASQYCYEVGRRAVEDALKN
ncbi:AAA family ATPase [Azospirillum sp. TSO22-1]|uniref:ATP-binding protein n=1 Tax=Azospirillum sp. TSO22-1 TaxID=716789 RepID=UPI000D650CF6|nr:AAA family ATPase [Azospirillum sp. TSO22-1]